MTDQLSFEQALQQLEKAVEKLEKGQVPLDEALETFESGVRNAALCRKMLRDVEARVETLIKHADNSFATEDFSSRIADVDD